MTPTTDLLAIKRLTDFVVARFRQELGLWYEINEGKSIGNYVNEANLTDGQSFLSLWFTSEPAGFANSSSLSDFGCHSVFVAWETRFDSRRIFDNQLMRSIAANAISQFDKEHALDRCALASFQFRTSLDINRISSWFKIELPDLNFRKMPDYHGTLRDSAEYVIDNDPNVCWAQIDFQPAISLIEFISMFAPYLIDFGGFRNDSNAAYEATDNWRRLGITRAHVLGRAF